MTDRELLEQIARDVQTLSDRSPTSALDLECCRILYPVIAAQMKPGEVLYARDIVERAELLGGDSSLHDALTRTLGTPGPVTARLLGGLFSRMQDVAIGGVSFTRVTKDKDGVIWRYDAANVAGGSETSSP